MNEARTMRLLIVGGTADALRMVKALNALSDLGVGHCVEISYSVAGLVRIPQLPCKVIRGGFSQHGGLRAYLDEHRIDIVLDMTHPYAVRISEAVNQATAACKIACWRFHRPEWQPDKLDVWLECEDWAAIVVGLKDKTSVFLTAGQLSQQTLTSLQSLIVDSGITFLLRTAVEPKLELPSGIKWIKSIGPFTRVDEMSLMRKYRVDALVTKNSGGDYTSGKIQAARELGLPVYMLKRPPVMPSNQLFTSFDQCEQYARDYFFNSNESDSREFAKAMMR